MDNAPLKPGCVKCYVTEIKPRFSKFALKNVLGDPDEQRTLEETWLNHIQWPWKEIYFLDEIPPAPPKATNVALEPVTVISPQQILCDSPDEHTLGNQMPEASTCDQPGQLPAIDARSSSQPEQLVARPTIAEDVSSV